MWPYLLGHYKFGSTPRDRQATDKAANEEFRSIMEEWKDVESVIRQQEKDREMDGISMDSTGSRDEVYEQLEMISNGLEKSENLHHQRVSIEEPEIEGLDDDGKARLMNGQLIIPNKNGDEAESGCCSDCGEENGKWITMARTCQRCSKRFNSSVELNGNGTGDLPNGHDSTHTEESSEQESQRTGHERDDTEVPVLCKQCSQGSTGSRASCQYSVSSTVESECYVNEVGSVTTSYFPETSPSP